MGGWTKLVEVDNLRLLGGRVGAVTRITLPSDIRCAPRSMGTVLKGPCVESLTFAT